MRTVSLLAVCLFPLVARAVDPGDPKALEVPTETQKKAEKWVKDFDDPDYEVRNAASAEIEKLGRLAYPALLAADRKGPSKLAKPRVAEALVRARELDFDARAEAFLADRKGKYKHALLGWNKLVAAAGDSEQTRVMFAAVLEFPGARELLLEAVRPPTATDEEDDDQLKHRMYLRLSACYRVYAQKRFLAAAPDGQTTVRADVPVTPFVANMIADLEYGKPYRNPGISNIGRMYLGTDEGKEAVKGEGKYGEAFNKLMDAWADQLTGEQLRGAASAYSYAGVRPEKYRDTLIRYVTEARKKKWAAGDHFWELAKIGDDKCLACLRSFLDSDEVLNKKEGIRERDVALWYCVQLTGQTGGGYGFSDGTPNYSCAFRDDSERTADEKRTAAFKKWAEWEKANPDKIKTKPAEKKEEKK